MAYEPSYSRVQIFHSGDGWAPPTNQGHRPPGKGNRIASVLRSGNSNVNGGCSIPISRNRAGYGNRQGIYLSTDNNPGMSPLFSRQMGRDYAKSVSTMPTSNSRAGYRSRPGIYLNTENDPGMSQANAREPRSNTGWTQTNNQLGFMRARWAQPITRRLMTGTQRPLELGHLSNGWATPIRLFHLGRYLVLTVIGTLIRFGHLVRPVVVGMRRNHWTDGGRRHLLVRLIRPHSPGPITVMEIARSWTRACSRMRPRARHAVGSGVEKLLLRLIRRWSTGLWIVACQPSANPRLIGGTHLKRHSRLDSWMSVPFSRLLTSWGIPRACAGEISDPTLATTSSGGYGRICPQFSMRHFSLMLVMIGQETGTRRPHGLTSSVRRGSRKISRHLMFPLRRIVAIRSAWGTALGWLWPCTSFIATCHGRMMCWGSLIPRLSPT